MVKQYNIREISTKDNLVLGADRELVLSSAGMSIMLVFVVMRWEAAIFGGVLWYFCLWALQLMAKADPKMRGVYMRNTKYKKYYPARSSHFYINRIER
jgi:type IV secretion system protein TrbD